MEAPRPMGEAKHKQKELKIISPNFFKKCVWHLLKGYIYKGDEDEKIKLSTEAIFKMEMKCGRITWENRENWNRIPFD